MTVTIFISYASDYRYSAHRLKQWLESLNKQFDVWWDESLEEPREWKEQLELEIQKRDFFIYLLTPSSVRSTHCRYEYNFAVKQSKNYVGIRLNTAVDNVMPEILRNFHYFDFTLRNIAQQENKLLNHLLGETSPQKLDVNSHCIDNLPTYKEFRDEFIKRLEWIKKFINEHLVDCSDNQYPEAHKKVKEQLIVLSEVISAEQPLRTHIQHINLFTENSNWNESRKSVKKALEEIQRLISDNKFYR